MEGDQSPHSLGELLRRTREARGWTIAQVEAATRIRRRHVEALEGDRLDVLPAPVFTRGLVRAYAKHLGLSQVEAEELLRKEEARHETVGVVPSVLNRPSIGSDPSTPLRVTLIVLILGIVAILAYVGLPRYRGLVAASSDAVSAAVLGSPTPIPASPTPRPTATAQPTATAVPTALPSATPLPPTPTLLPSGVATATAAASIRGVTIEARASGRVWSQVEADGQVVFSGILQTSEKKTWRAERTIVLHVGNAGLVDVTFNGQSLGNLGPNGDVVKREWTSAR